MIMRKILNCLTAATMLFCMTFTLFGCAATDSSDTSTVVENAEKITETAEYDDCIATILDAEIVDDDGSPAMKVRFEYTNNGEEGTYFYGAFATKAFQDGIELDEIGLNYESEECENLTVEIKDGAKLTCAMVFPLRSESDVEVIIGTPTADEETLAEKTFQVNN
jgi:hypothetical protein